MLLVKEFGGECRSCGANVEGKENTREAAVEAWNRRAERWARS